MMHKAAAMLFAASAVGSTAMGASVLNDWNLIVRNGVNGASEVDGSALVGGNIAGSTNYAVQGVTAPNGDGLALGGNINNGVNVSVNNGGNLRIGGSVNGIANVNGGATISDAGVSSMVANALNEVVALQTSLGALTANGSIDGAGNMNASPVDMNGSNIAVYSFNISTVQSLGQLNLNFGSADTVVLNVASDAGTIDFNAPPNLIGGFNQNNSSHIIWNFFDATDVVVNNTFNGALLATGADLRVLGGGINGTVVVDSVSALNAEIRRHTFDGWLPPEEDMTAIPLPTAGVMSLTGIVALGARRRRAL